jgi:hypothetical protein
VDTAWSTAPAHPWDHPDWVLARAVAAGVLDRTEATLIGATRLEDIPLADAAAALNVDPTVAASWRHRSEVRLAQALTAGEVDTAHTRVLRPAGERLRRGQILAAKAARARRRAASTPAS